MEPISIQGTGSSPTVILNSQFEANKCLIEFSGKSYAENTFNFYKPFLEWIKNYFDGKTKEITEVNLKLIYFNSATTQVLYSLLDILEGVSSDGLVVNWFYDPEDELTYEDYEDYAEDFPDLNITAVKYEVKLSSDE